MCEGSKLSHVFKLRVLIRQLQHVAPCNHLTKQEGVVIFIGQDPFDEKH